MTRSIRSRRAQISDNRSARRSPLVTHGGHYQARVAHAAFPPSTFSAKSQVILARPPSIKSGIVYLTGARYGKTFRLELNQSWEAVDIQTGASVVIPKGSHKAVRVLHHTSRDEKEEPWLVVMVQHKGKPVSAGLREAYWRQWESHHILEFRVTIEEWKEIV